MVSDAQTEQAVVQRASQRKPGKSKESTKDDGKEHLGDGVFGLSPVYWQEPTVAHSIWKNCHGRSVVGRARMNSQ